MKNWRKKLRGDQVFLENLRRGAKYCDDYVCLSVSLLDYKLHGQTSPDFLYMMPVAVAGPFWQHCYMLFTSGFMDGIFIPWCHWPYYTHIRFTALWTLSRITRVSQYQKVKTSLDFTEARDSEW